MKSKNEIAIFAGGCFWHIENAFEDIPGIVSTIVGYTGGKLKNPSYEQVCSLNTGHVESVQIIFNPRELSYENLLDHFWNIHNPTTKDRQGPDIGSQYNSVIFYTSKKQKKIAKKSKKERQKNMKGKIVTRIRKATKFWPAEEYHQKYMQKHKKGLFFIQI